ncbi:DUF3043 domain-containing protein [Microbacterium gorillae]|uniref:DUF3043 domain-containing protein n=1 Tax=Microbacterium gorillae TaxID=1231063 RepID=UPI0005904027|nr:DUF3043 domain-containing protein [Microbacterium gorillae]
MAQKAEIPAPDAEDRSTSGKGRATPTRAEQEAARKRPLAPDTKEAKAAARSRASEQRRRASDGMAAGEEKYLPAKDKGPQRRFARDYVDAGWHVGEIIMPAMLVVILISMIPSTAVYYIAFLALIVLVLFMVGDMLILGRTVKKKLAAKYGEDRLERGLGWYSAMRSMQMRFIRLPKPQVKRGQYPS